LRNNYIAHLVPKPPVPHFSDSHSLHNTISAKIVKVFPAIFYYPRHIANDFDAFPTEYNDGKQLDIIEIAGLNTIG